MLEAIDCCSIDFIDALVCQYLDGFRLEAYQVQEAIGWQQVLLGQITAKWEQLANNNGSEDAGKKRYMWTGRVTRLAWKYGLDVWQMRNKIVHGSDQMAWSHDWRLVRLKQ